MTRLVVPDGEIPLPRTSLVAEPFWEGCARNELLFQRCADCGRAIFNPSPVCRYCTSRDLAWERSAGLGTVYSWTLAHRPQSPAFPTPYAPVIVELDEGYHMLSNLIDCDSDEVRVGLHVEVVFHRMNDARTLPYFRPRAGVTP